MLTEKMIHGLFSEGKISAEQRERLLSLLEAKPKKMAGGGVVKLGKTAQATEAQASISQNQPSMAMPQEVVTESPIEPQSAIKSTTQKDATIAANQGLQLEQVKTQAAMQSVADIQDAVAKVGYAKAVSDVYDQELKRRAMIDAEKERLTQDYVAKHEQIFAQLADKSIDPNRWWKNKSTGDKVLLSVGTFLAGLGSGENQVLRMIQNAIDSDIRSQVADLQRSEMMGKQVDNVFRAYKELYNDQTAASLAAKEAMLRGVEAKLNEMEMPLKNDIQKANLQRLRAEIEALRIGTQEKLKAAVIATPEYHSRLSTVEKIANISDPKIKDAAMKEYEIEKTFPVLRKQVQDAFNEAASFSVKRVYKTTDADQRLRTAMINAYEAVTGNDIKQNEKAIDAMLGGFLPDVTDGEKDIKEKQQRFEKFLIDQKNARTKTLQILGITTPEVDRSQFKKVR